MDMFLVKIAVFIAAFLATLFPLRDYMLKKAGIDKGDKNGTSRSKLSKPRS